MSLILNLKGVMFLVASLGSLMKDILQDSTVMLPGFLWGIFNNNSGLLPL